MPNKFTTWDWDDTTTPQVLFDKAIEHLQKTPSPRPDEFPFLYDMIDGATLGHNFQGYPGVRWSPTSSIPRFRWLAIYAVEGDNEGHYIHVDLVIPHDVRPNPYAENVSLMFFKTFAGMNFSLEVVKTLTTFFYFNA